MYCTIRMCYLFSLEQQVFAVRPWLFLKNSGNNLLECLRNRKSLAWTVLEPKACEDYVKRCFDFSLSLSLQPWSKVQNPVCFVFTKERTFETLWIRECCQPTLKERGGRTAHSSQRCVCVRERKWVSEYAAVCIYPPCSSDWENVIMKVLESRRWRG